MINIEFLIKAIASPALSSIKDIVQRNRRVIEIKEKLGISPAQPPQGFEDVYAHALVEYGLEVKQDCDDIQLRLNLEFFNNRKVRNIFHQTFTSLKSPNYDYQQWKLLRDKAQKDRIDVAQIEKFYQVYFHVAKRSRNPGEVITFLELQHSPNSNQNLENLHCPDEFRALIEEKTKAFCGREFVFDEFNNFLNKQNKGYFTVIGDAGMGKSAIAAKAVLDYKAICYFNIRAEGRNTPEQFLASIRQQLINRYQLQNAKNDNLPSLLTQVSKKLTADENLIIVVDALDEVEQPGSGNLLDLPKNLPDRIYFLLTRRRYADGEKRLLNDEFEQQLDLTAHQYQGQNRKDVEKYISKFLSNEVKGKDLEAWIKKRNIQPPYFIEQIAQKSENNFMYLYYVLPSIARGDYEDLSLEGLPEKLQGYYEQHWKQMQMDTHNKQTNAIILCVLVEVGKPISCQSIARITNKDENDVLELLKKWLEFLRTQKQAAEDYYSIYHQSFADFLRNQPSLKRAKNSNNIDWQEVQRLIIDWQEVQRLISDFNDQLWKDLKSGEDEDE